MEEDAPADGSSRASPGDADLHRSWRAREFKCFETKLKLHGGPLTLPRSYVYATLITPAGTFGPFARRAKSEAGWRYLEIDASHSPNVTAPEALMRLLQKIVAHEKSHSQA